MRRAYMMWRTHSSGVEAKLYANVNFDGDWQQRYFPGSDAGTVECATLDGVASDTGNEPCLFYDEELAGPGGMSFRLFKEPNHTEEDVRRAKAWLRHTRDVVRFIVVRITHWSRDAESKELEPQPSQA